MKREEALKKVDFLNKRLRKLNTPWYSWNIKMNWKKIDKWLQILGYREESEKE